MYSQFSLRPHALDFIKDIGRRIKESTGEKRATSYLMQTIGMRGTHDNFDAYNHFYCSKIGKKKLCFYSSIVQYGPSTQSTMNFFLS